MVLCLPATLVHKTWQKNLMAHKISSNDHVCFMCQPPSIDQRQQQKAQRQHEVNFFSQRREEIFARQEGGDIARPRVRRGPTRCLDAKLGAGRHICKASISICQVYQTANLNYKTIKGVFSSHFCKYVNAKSICKALGDALRASPKALANWLDICCYLQTPITKCKG